MKFALAGAAALLLAGGAVAQTNAPAPFAAGRPLGVMLDGAYTPMSRNVKMFGALVNTESCAYDADRGLILAINRGAAQNEVPNDAFVSLINSDGSVHTARWIGGTRDGMVMNHPFGSDIQNGKLYLADRDGGTADGAPSVSVIRMFDLKTGAPAGEIRTEGSGGFNDIEVARDGTIWATQTGSPTVPMRLYRVSASGEATVVLEGAPLNLPNGVSIDNDGNVVVLNMGSDEILTVSPDGKVLKTARAAQPGSDGIVITKDGTKYISSVRQGGISRIPPGRPAELIATGIPSAASMCHDEKTNQLVIPMNPNNGLAFVKLD